MKLGIKSKLAITLLAANCLVAVAMYWISSKSFDDSFLDFVTQVELQRLEPFQQELALLYEQNGSWDWLDQRLGLWAHLSDYHIRKQDSDFKRKRQPPPQFKDGARGKPPKHRGDGFHRRPPPPDEIFEDFRKEDYQIQVPRLDNRAFNIDPFIILRDEFENILRGRVNPNLNYEWLAISVNGEKVGDIGVQYKRQLSSNLEQYFIKQQKSMLAMIVVIMLSVALLLSFLLSNKLLRIIKQLQIGLSKLVKGEFDSNLPVNSNDELGQLSSNVNFLAKTLKENQQSRQQWIADISHELRTPVAILKGELEALIDGVRKIDGETLTSLQQEADRLAKLINDLHELSLSDLGALSYKKEAVDLVELVSEFLTDQRSRTNVKDLTISFDSELINCDVLIDADRIEQCFNNLMQNTLRYTDMPGKLNVSLNVSNNKAVLSWEDSSPGVSNDDISRLFDRLYRVEQSRNRAKGGAGLGMSICKNIIDAQGADIHLFQSDLGGLGITITFQMLEKT